MSKLVCKGVSKKYKDKLAVKNVDLTLESGKIYGLIGRNGAGKSTLLSLMSAQAPLTAGSVEIDGEPVWENQKSLNRICFSRELNVSGNNGIAGMKIKDYLKMAALYYPAWDAELAARLVDAFEIDIKKQIMKANKGMLSAVTITIALASKAEFTFLDEPVAGLDVIAREYFYKELLSEFSESGRCFVISTHIIEEAANVFEDVIILRNGEIIANENTQELIDRCKYVSGLEEAVNKATSGVETHHAEMIGRAKTVAAILRGGEHIEENEDVTVKPMSLQNIFVALCGEEVQQ